MQKQGLTTPLALSVKAIFTSIIIALLTTTALALGPSCKAMGPGVTAPYGPADLLGCEWVRQGGRTAFLAAWADPTATDGGFFYSSDVTGADDNAFRPANIVENIPGFVYLGSVGNLMLVNCSEIVDPFDNLPTCINLVGPESFVDHVSSIPISPGLVSNTAVWAETNGGNGLAVMLNEDGEGVFTIVNEDSEVVTRQILTHPDLLTASHVAGIVFDGNDDRATARVVLYNTDEVEVTIVLVSSTTLTPIVDVTLPGPDVSTNAHYAIAVQQHQGSPASIFWLCDGVIKFSTLNAGGVTSLDWELIVEGPDGEAITDFAIGDYGLGDDLDIMYVAGDELYRMLDTNPTEAFTWSESEKLADGLMPQTQTDIYHSLKTVQVGNDVFVGYAVTDGVVGAGSDDEVSTSVVIWSCDGMAVSDLQSFLWVWIALAVGAVTLVGGCILLRRRRGRARDHVYAPSPESASGNRKDSSRHRESDMITSSTASTVLSRQRMY